MEELRSTIDVNVDQLDSYTGADFSLACSAHLLSDSILYLEHDNSASNFDKFVLMNDEKVKPHSLAALESWTLGWDTSYGV